LEMSSPMNFLTWVTSGWLAGTSELFIAITSKSGLVIYL
jgi:hypothetical protein